MLSKSMHISLIHISVVAALQLAVLLGSCGGVTVVDGVNGSNNPPAAVGGSNSNPTANAVNSPKPPNARLTATPRTVTEGQTILLDASASTDPDGSIVGYEFDRDGDGDYETETSKSSVSFMYPNAGEFTAKVRVKDNGGNKSVASYQVSVLKPGSGGTTGGGPVGGTNPGVDKTPVARLSATPGTTGQIPFSVTFSASASTDPDGSIVTYEFDPDGDGTYQSKGTAKTSSYTYKIAGEFEARVRVIDNDGNSAVQTLIITALAPGQTGGGGTTTKVAPTLSLTVRPGTSGSAPFEVEFDASASVDADGTIVKYEFDADGAGGFEKSGAVSKYTYTYNTAGNFTAKVRVTDNDGNSAEASVAIKVEPPFDPNNAAPIARLDVKPKSSGVAPFKAVLDGSSSTDADGTIVKYEFDADGDGVIDKSGPDSSIEYTYAVAGQYEVWMRVTDNGNRTSIATATLAISDDTGGGTTGGGTTDPPDDGNYSPIAIMLASKLYGSAPLEVEFKAGLSLDIDGTITRWEWDIDGQGPFPQGPLGDPKTIVVTFTTPGTYWAKLTVTDDEGATASLSLPVIVAE